MPELEYGALRQREETSKEWIIVKTLDTSMGWVLANKHSGGAWDRRGLAQVFTSDKRKYPSYMLPFGGKWMPAPNTKWPEIDSGKEVFA